MVFSILSFSFETSLSARSNKAVITFCFADVGLCDVYFRYWFVCIGFLQVFTEMVAAKLGQILPES